MSGTIYLNGSFVSAADARIMPNDRGYNFADGVYEVVKYYNGKPFRLEDHIARLRYSLAEVGIKYTLVEDLPIIFEQLLQYNNLDGAEAGVYLQITRGAHRRVHFMPGDITPTVYAWAFPFPSFSEGLDKGIGVITAEDIRWLRCDIKSISLLPNTMLYQKAVEAGAGETFLIRNNILTEATHSSVFAVLDGVLHTHPLSNLILPGITRKVILEICRDNNIQFREEAIGADDLNRLTEVFITGTGSEVMPVVSIDGKAVGSGKPGSITRNLQKLFFEQVGLQTNQKS